jgi:tetraacyldisaccharide 4'-kinase
MGLEVIEHDYPDHHQFVSSDLIFDDELQVLMTEKDAVKCQVFSNARLWYVPVNAALSEHLHQQFLSRVNSCIYAGSSDE